MSKRQQYLVIHTLGTKPDMVITKGILQEWHKGPKDNENGTVTYLGKTYPSRNLLPPHKINGISIKIINGRGWDRLGYSQLIHREGNPETLTPYKVDGIIENHEVTWGATGINSVSRHLALEGGWVGNESVGIWDFFTVYTENQFIHLMSAINHELDIAPWIKVIGHNQVSTKSCPNFDVPTFLNRVGIPKNNLLFK